MVCLKNQEIAASATAVNVFMYICSSPFVVVCRSLLENIYTYINIYIVSYIAAIRRFCGFYVLHILLCVFSRVSEMEKLIVVVFVVIAKFFVPTKGWTSQANAILLFIYIRTDNCMCSWRYTFTTQWTMQRISILIGIKNNSRCKENVVCAPLFIMMLFPLFSFLCLYSSENLLLLQAKYISFFCCVQQTFQCVKHERIYVLFFVTILLGTVTRTEPRTSNTNSKYVLVFFFWLDSKSVYVRILTIHSHKSRKEKRPKSKNFLWFCFECLWLEWDNTKRFGEKTTWYK